MKWSAKNTVSLCVVLACGALFVGAGLAANPVDDIEHLKIEAHPDDPERILLHVDALIEDIPQQIDLELGGRLGVSCSRNIYWDGGTHIMQDGATLELRSKVRYEHWLCAILKTRLFRKTFDVDWTLGLNEGARLDALVLTAQLANIRDFPGELEQWFDLREKLRRDIRIPIPSECGRCDCEELTKELTPVADRFRFEVKDSDDVLVRAVFSVASDLSPLTRCM